MKRHAFIILGFIIAMTVTAVPARRGQWRVIHLSDGSSVRVELRGDENYHWWEDSLCQRYVLRGDTRGVCSEECGVNDKEIWEKIEEKDWSKRRNTRRYSHSTLHTPHSTNPLLREGQGLAPRRGLIILASFADCCFEKDHTRELYERIANEEDFVHELGFKGSVHDYFKDQSGGQFLIDFDVVGPVPLSMNYAYYGENDADGLDIRAGEMIAEACKLAAKEVDFADYDWDGDGEVEQVVVLFAGQGEHCCDDEDTIWPHEFQLEDGDYGHSLTLDGMTISTYACCSELSVNKAIEGIGTLCHEFSHCLGLPDMYDTMGNGCFGMSMWDIMDEGCYNNNGFTPCSFTSYERMVCGWQQPVELTREQDVTDMRALSQQGKTYIIYNANAPNEYYLLENRQPTGWDEALPGNGLLIIHVDENDEVWQMNRVNTIPDHQRCTIYHADNEIGTSLRALSGDTYPWADNDSLTSLSSPAATLYHQSVNDDYFMPMSLTHIRQQEGTVSFHFSPLGEGGLPNPLDDTVFYESFNQNSGKGGNDDKWSGNIALARFVPDHGGWSGNKPFGANQCAKFGTTSAHGMAITPPIYLNGSYEMTFLAAPWGNDENFIWLSVESGSASLSQQIFDVMKNNQWNEHHVTIKGRGYVKLLLYGNSRRFFLDEVIIKRTGGVATGIDEELPEMKKTGIYTLEGIPVPDDTSLPPGIYLINGRKIVR